MERSKRCFYIFFLWMAVIILLFNYINENNVEENINNISFDLGNFFVIYYCNIINAILEKKDFDIEKLESPGWNVDVVKDEEFLTNEFMKNLPRRISYDPDLQPYSELFNTAKISEKQDCSTPYFRFTNMNIIKCLEIIRPLMHDIIDKTFQKTKDLDLNMIRVDHPVIHFRCADTPFIGNPDYKLRRFSYFRKALEIINEKKGIKYNKITILSYVKHRSSKEQQEICELYALMLQSYLHDNFGYEVIIENRTNIEDFATLFYAPAVLSTGGSYSLMSGFFGYGLFIQPQDYPLPESVDWLIPDMNVEHGTVDYYNADEVLNALQMT